jgi:hypothetical protein
MGASDVEQEENNSDGRGLEQPPRRPGGHAKLLVAGGSAPAHLRLERTT